MAYSKTGFRWLKSGVMPPETLQNEGFTAGSKVPADYLNAQWSATYEAIKELQEKSAEKTVIEDSLKSHAVNNLKHNNYATCNTAASTAAKTVTLADFTLNAGTSVSIKFSAVNTASNPTLNVNGTGAKPLKQIDGSAFTNIKASIYTLIYDGTNYVVQDATVVEDSVTSISTVNAASASSVKKVYDLATTAQTTAEGKVDKEAGKGLSTNDYTTTEKTKLAGISAGATNTTLSDSTSTSSSTTAASSTAVKTVNDSLTTHSNLSASTSAKGHVQLTSSTSSTSTTLAATASAVKATYDLATTAKTSADSAAAEIVNARITANGATYSTLKERLDAMSRTLPKVYGIKIDTTNSNPATALTYVDDATGFAPAKMDSATDTFDYGSWADKYPFNAIKPCLFKNGQVVGYLNPNDYSKFVNGTSADITSGDSGDVMIEFPQIYWKFETIGTDLYIRYSNEKVDEGFKSLAHQRASLERDKCYISAYLGTEVSSKLRSLSGKTPVVSKTIGAFRTLAQANGSGYDQMAYYQLLMLQVLYIVMFKDRDSQTALGRGYVDGNSAKASTGNLNNKGLFYGETTGKVQMKFCGIEDFYGNLFYFVDGIFSDSSYNILINNQSFNDTGANYTNYGQGATADLTGHINSVQGGNETGFIAKATSGSATTHYPDYGYLNASCIADFGGSWASASKAGAFTLRLCNSASYSSLAIGARLMFC